MTDTLFPDTWPHIDIDRYVEQYRSNFDEIDLQRVPHYRLVQKIKVRSFVLGLLENDPLKKERQQLNDAILNEVRRQVFLLTGEYNLRVDTELMDADNQAKTFLSKYIPLREGYKPPAQVIGMQTLDLTAVVDK